jgi:uncharacterized protein YjbJ (UPF0337 family)
MNWDQMQGKWKQLKGHAKEQWGKLTDDDLEVIGGARERLIGKLQERYGYAREDAQRRADEWMKALHEEPDYAHTHSGSSSQRASGSQMPSGSPEHMKKR